MRQVLASTLAIALGTACVWLIVLSWRAPYLPQIPVFDMDVTTAAASMWTRNWWNEGGARIGFSLPYGPLSVETPTLQSRRLYESWPPGAFFPIYLVAALLRQEPSVPMINWINAVSHGILALAVSLTALVVGRLNRLRWPSATLLALCTLPPVLMPKGLVYVFSQLYCHTTHVLPFVGTFILLAALHLHLEDGRSRDTVLAALLAVAFWSFLIDWLPYVVFGWWLLTVLVGARLGHLRPLGRRATLAALALPVLSLGLYFAWRLFTPGSMARTRGILFSLRELAWKVLYRVGVTDDHPFTGSFVAVLRQIHEEFFSSSAFPLIVASSLLVGAAATALFVLHRGDPQAQSRLYATASIALLCVVPIYAHMYLLKQHTAIHHFQVSKAVFAFSLVPFVFLPLTAYLLARQLTNGERGGALAGGLALAAALVAGRAAFHGPVLMGRVQPEVFAMWDSIGRRTAYRDVVFSAELEAIPISVQVGVSYKLVHCATSFEEIDRHVRRICEPFDVVLVGTKRKSFAWFRERSDGEVFTDRSLTFVRFRDYPGAREGCS
jgi:hypothetical protein